MFRTILATLFLGAAVAAGSFNSAPAHAAPATAPTATLMTHSASSCAATSTVRPGDWLARIAARYNTSWQRLAAANHLPNPNLIFPGQRLCVPAVGGGAGAGGKAFPHAIFHPGQHFSNTAAPGQCTWYAAHIRADLDLRWAGNAHDWAASARARGYTTGALPAVGSIAVFAPGVDGANAQFGHVAIVIATNGSVFEVAAMAAPTDWVVSDSWHALKSGEQFIYG